MRALVVTSNPATAASEPESPAAALSDLGCEVVAVGYDVDQLPEDIELQRPSVVVVDAGAHLEVGRAAIRRVREVGSLADVPVLLCVEVSRLAGLDPEAGADDFVLSPVVAPELYARIRQLDWRMSSFRAAGRIKIGDLVIDAVAVEASYRGRALKLPRQEFQLLKFLAERPGRVFSREQLLSRVWGYRYAGGTRTVDIHVRRLRAKLGPGSAMIETVRHVGYKLRAPGGAPALGRGASALRLDLPAGAEYGSPPAQETPPMPEMNLIQAVNDALKVEMRRDRARRRAGRGRRPVRRRVPRDRRPAGRVRRRSLHRHAARRVRHHRHRDRDGALRPAARSPRSSSATSSIPAFDQIVNELAKFRYRSGGEYPGAGRGPHAGRRRHPGRALPLAVARGVLHAHPRAEGRLPVEPDRRQGPARQRDPRRRSGDLHGAEAHLPRSRRPTCPRASTRSRSARRRSCAKARQVTVHRLERDGARRRWRRPRRARRAASIWR